MKKLFKNKKIMKKAGILLIAAILILSTAAAMANTVKKERVPTLAGVGGAEDDESGLPNPIGEEMIGFYNSVNDDAIGLDSSGFWEAAIRMTPEELIPYEDWVLIGAQFYYHEDRNVWGQLRIYEAGTPTQPGSLLSSKDFYCGYNPGWVRIDLDESVQVNSDEDIWVSFKTFDLGEDYFPFAVDAGPAVDGKGDWAYIDEQWQELQYQGFDINWNIDAIVFGDPILTADANGPYEGYVDEPIEFSGSAYNGVEPYTWHWDFGNGDTSDEQNPSYAYPAAGEYNVTLTVTDNENSMDNDTTTASVYEELVADANGPYEGFVGEPIEFSGSATGGKEPYTWHWDFGNGDTSDEQNPSYAYPVAGEYDVTLTVTDNLNTIDSDTTMASVEGAELEIGKITGGLLKVDAEIMNVGDANATNVNWSITLDGGIILVGGEASDTIATLEAGGTEIVLDKPILGFGSVKVTVMAIADNVGEVSKTADGFVFLFFVIIK